MKRTLNFIGHLHHKNEEGINLFDRDLFNVERNGQSRDVVIHCSDTSAPIGNLDIYGPQLDFRNAASINTGRINLLSEWVCNCSRSINPNANYISLPFPVNIEKFKPGEKHGSPIIYFKRREINLFEEIKSFILSKYPNAIQFRYESGYSELDYINACANAPFCIWVGAHESQGFALQECLSSGTPIFVIDVDSLHNEISVNGHRYWGPEWSHIKATPAPYFDDTCGMITNVNNWRLDFDEFISKLSSYNPRSYVEENLSPEALSKKWLTEINK